jgi:hypothetical protein
MDSSNGFTVMRRARGKEVGMIGGIVGICMDFTPEETHVFATRLATYVSSDFTTTKATNQSTPYGLIQG